MDTLRLNEEIVFSLRRNGPEFRFWITFFGMVNQAWLSAFQQRTMGGENYIYWDFIDKVNKGLTKGQQYQEALAVVFDKTTNSLSANDCRLLVDTAIQVMETRRMEHNRFRPDPESHVWSIHERILQLWITLVELIQEKSRT